MKVAYLRTTRSRAVFVGPERRREGREQGTLATHSVAKDMVRQLRNRGLIHDFEEWRFWDAAEEFVEYQDDFPVHLFPADGDGRSQSFLEFAESTKAPDLIWIEGRGFPPHIQQIHKAFPGAFKIVYSKNDRPWNIRGLDKYSLCLVDEEWQRSRLLRDYPSVQCCVWDKYVDCENVFMPLDTPKRFDVCYVASLRERKRHELLFSSLARIGASLTCLCVGGDPEGRQGYLAAFAEDRGLSVTFTGEVTKAEVNKYLNQARISVMCSEVDSAPRAIIESLAAGVPVLVNSELKAGQRYISDESGLGGLICSPEEFHLGLEYMIRHEDVFQPRVMFEKRFAPAKVLDLFLTQVRAAGLRI